MREMVIQGKTVTIHTRKRISKNKLGETLELLIMASPHIILTFIFSYLPMIGIVLAFKHFNPNLGIFASPWNGLENFRFFFESNDFGRIMRNTILYGLSFLIIGNLAAIALAVMLYNIRSRFSLKYYQTTMILPNFLSMVLIAYIVYALLNPAAGILNQIIAGFGGRGLEWYSNAKYWPFILTIVHVWKSVGIQAIIFYAGLIGIDESLFEAARIDGATKRHEIMHIMIPELTGLICIYIILGIGGLMGGDFGLFYQVPMNIGTLYSTTDIINTYVFRALQDSTNMGATTAVGLFQSAAGLVLILISNSIIKKIAPERSFF